MFSRWLWSGIYFAVCGVWVFVVLVATAQPLHAYIDPGSGLLLIQAAGSTLAGIGYLLRRRIREFFRRLAGRSAESH
ncbi:MAG TPA: hypothetical protein VKT75_06900 [Acidobacteriaceae bacterium]|nr:hypothetical protein [Acidobacteriaceae bacterium]